MAHGITEVGATNYKGVRGTISIPVDGKNLVVIAGANGAGKSSLIDAIAEIIDPKGTKITSRPIHEGAESAEAHITTDTLVATRTWKANDAGTLKVTALDGAVHSKGRDLILGLTGAAMLEPFEFDALKDAEQRAALLELVELPFDLDHLEGLYKAEYDKRTEAAREAKRLESLLSSKPSGIALNGPTDEVSQAAVLAELEAAQTTNGQRFTLQTNLTKTRERIAELEGLLAAAAAALVVGEQAFEGLPELVDTDAIRARLGDVEMANARARDTREWAKVAEDWKVAEANLAEVQAAIDVIVKQKAEGLAAAKFPVQGLSVDGDRILFDGLPTRQINSAQRIILWFRLAVSKHPDLRLAIIRDGDRLDSDSLAEIDRIATAADYLVLVERDRDESREIGFTIVDGELSA